MGERVNRRISKNIGSRPDDKIEFGPVDGGQVSSPVRAAADQPLEQADLASETGPAAGSDEKVYSPEFLELAEPTLPQLEKRNRARLLMQSPNRLYFYWSIAKNPFHTLNRALGEGAHYTLVLKLVDLNSGIEDIHPVDAAGNWWFSVDADKTYRAEIGFYAVNRPYIRILYSNVITTPRKSPSPRTAETAEWRVPADRFARVLDAAGFARDAFDVALAGDDPDAADTATHAAFSAFSGKPAAEFAHLGSEELRYAMLALASGVSIEELRGLISEKLFAVLSALSGATGERAFAALQENFELDAEEFEIGDEIGPAVYGASLINFPRSSRKGRKLSDLGPFSSHSVRPSS
jgi:hypothetical protein